MTKCMSHVSVALAATLCLGASLANNAEAAPTRVPPSTVESLATVQQIAPDTKVTQVYWTHRHGHHYWVRSHRVHGRYYR